MPEHWLIWAIVLLAVLFDYINGFHDTANAIATSVSTRAITPRHAIMMAAVLNFAGAMVSTGVAKTIGGDLVLNPAQISLEVIVAALIGSIIWNIATWYYRIPSSSSHSLIGGVIGALDFAGGDVLVGSRRFMQEEGVQGMPEKSDKSWGKNLLFVARDKQYIGCLTIEDPVRPAMKKTLNQMRRIGVDEVIMLTGDSKEVAAEVAREMDIDSYHAEILPEDKANYVMKLQKRGSVMMVGDGINDAPALAFADIGVSLGGNKTDIAAESAAITIRSEDPGKLYDALKIGRQTMKVINQNFTATIVVNSAAMLLGALGRISPLWAAVIHNTATLAVVLNSVRILGVSRRMVKA